MTVQLQPKHKHQQLLLHWRTGSSLLLTFCNCLLPQLEPKGPFQEAAQAFETAFKCEAESWL